MYNTGTIHFQEHEHLQLRSYLLLIEGSVYKEKKCFDKIVTFTFKNPVKLHS